MKMKRMLALLLAGLITLSCCPVSVLAAEVLSETESVSAELEEIPETEQTTEPVYAVVAEGTCGDDLTWVLDERGVLTISGTGVMADYANNAKVRAPWYSYRSSITGLLLEEGISHIGNYAFYNCTALTDDLVIPDSVVTIGDAAFNSCTALNGTLTLPEGLTSIGSSAFRDCELLTGDLVIPDSVTAIGAYAFYDCRGFTSALSLPAGLTELGSYAFYNCSGLIGDLVVPEGITEISAYAFYNCTNLNGILSLPEGLTSIGVNAFYYCRNLTGSLVLPESLTGIGGGAFDYCAGFTGTLVVPDGVTTLPSKVFKSMTGITSLVIGEGVERIYVDNSHNNFNALDGMSNVAEMTFKGLTPPDISGKIAPFYGMNKLKTIYVPADAYGLYAESFTSRLTGNMRLMPSEAEADFLIRDGVLLGYFGQDTEVVIPDTIEEIGAGVFRNNTAITSVTLPEGLTTIGAYAFYGCSNLAEINLPDSVTAISEYAFYSCKALNGTLELPEGLTSIGSYAFGHCTGITGELVIPEGLTEISSSAFRNVQVKTLVLSENIGYIADYAFSSVPLETITFKGITPPESVGGQGHFIAKKNALTAIYVPAGSAVAYYDAYSFYMTKKAKILIDGAVGDWQIDNGILLGYFGEDTEVVIPEGVTAIANAAFMNHDKITKVTIPDTVTTIGAYAFYRCTALQAIDLPDSLTAIGEYAFYYCMEATGELVIPKGVTEIGNYAFYACEKLTGLTLSEDLLTIGGFAFQYCSGLTGELVIPDKLERINNAAFSRGYGITSIVIGEKVNWIYTGSGDSHPFFGMSAVTEITFKGETVPALSASSYSLFQDMTALETVYVPEAAYSAYAEAYSKYLPEGVRLAIAGDESKDFQIEDGILVAYLGEGGDVVIPEAVTAIGAAAFQNCTGLTGVTFHDGITSIGDSAFYGCTGLTGSLILPEGLTEIGISVFQNCTGLTGVTFHDGITYIGTHAFDGCTGLAGIDLPDGLTEVGDYAFSGCIGLTGSLILPEGVTRIGQYAFYNCNKLSGSLILPEGLTGIGQYAFYNCPGFTGALVLPDGVTELGKNTFRNMKGITSISLGKNLTSIYSDYATHAFYNMNALREMTFRGATVPTVTDNSIFRQMNALEAVYVPAGSFDAYAAAYSAWLPNSARLLVDGAEEDFVIEDGVLVVYQGEGGEVVIPEGVTAIGPSAFQNCVAMTGVTIPEGVTTIGDYAFEECTGLTSIDLPESLSVVDSYAFYNCDGLTGELVIPGSVTAIGDSAFYSCGKLTALTIKAGADKTIGSNAFAYSLQLTNLSLGEGITSIGSSAFYNCSKLTGDLILPDSITTIGSAAFSGCRGFNGTLRLPANLQVMGQMAFFDCTGFVGELVVPDGLAGIDNQVFGNLSGITSLVIGEGVQWIYSHYDYHQAFRGMSGVTEITFKGTTVPSITSNSPFRDMPALTAVYVPAEAYDAYVAAYGGYVAEGVIRTIDLMQVAVTGLRVEKVGSRSVTLAWDAHVSEDVVGYTVLRDGEAVGTTAECTFADSGLQPGRSYTYIVYGYTADERTTAAAEITATTVQPAVLDIDVGNTLNKIGVQNTVEIHAFNNVETAAVTLSYLLDGKAVSIGTAVYNEKLSGAAEAIYTISWDIADLPDGSYTLLARLTDGEGTAAEYSETFTVDHRIPAPITDVTAISDATSIHVTWAMAAEADTAGYRVYRRSEIDTEFYLVARINDRSVQTYIDESPRTDRIYYYYVTGVNNFGQEGQPSEIAGATLAPDKEAPIVLRMQPGNGGWLKGNVTITMEATDNVSVTKTVLSYSVDGGADWTVFGTGRGNTFSALLNTADLPDGELRIKAEAEDAAGNKGAAMVYTYRVDNHGPQQVTGLVYTATNVTITLRWDDVADEDLHFYRVERKNADGSYTKVRDVYDTLGINLSGLTAGTDYTYRVVGYDLAGNRGTPSADLTATTLNDQTAPVITLIRPLSGHFRDRIDLTFTAEDEQNVDSITVQASGDGKEWWDVHTESYTDAMKRRTLSYTLELEGYNEGDLYIRAVAADSAGNISDASETAPFVQHKVDRTPPAAPEAVRAVGYVGYIEITWQQGSDADLNGYAVYRAEAPEGPFELLKTGIHAVNYIDRTAEEGILYDYRVAALDLAGNESLPVMGSAQVISDISAPAVVITPKSGSTLGAGYRTLSVTAADDRLLDTIVVEYSTDGSAYTEHFRLSGIGEMQKSIRTDLPMDVFADGGTAYVRAAAIDAAGNRSAWVEAQYAIDRSAPAVREAEATFDGEKVQLSWTGLQESDLIGYKVYRKGTVGSYSLIAQRQATAEQSDYTCYDYDLAAEAVTYTYKIEAMDACGNTSSAELTITLPDRSMPVPVIDCETVLEAGVEYYIDGSASSDNTGIAIYHFDFGDGTTSNEAKPIHVYAEVGTYTITLTVTDTDGNVATAEKQITVRPRGMLGSAKIRVVDQDGKAVPNAPVYFDLESEQQVVRNTDANGYVTFTAEVGKHLVGCVIANNSWLPVQKEIIVTAGAETEITLILVRHVMIEGQFEIKRMTFEEIEAEGIDVSKPENQHFVKVNLTLTYGTEKVDTVFRYNEITGETIAPPTIVPSDGGYRKIYPVVIPNPEEGGLTEESVIAYLDIPVGASALKEFFEVKLHILNHASEDFSMLDNVIELHLPEGLTLVDSYASADSTVVNIKEIKGQTAETITWHLRGDQIGEYHLTADYSGILSAFQTPVHVQFLSAEPVEVRGLSDLTLTAVLPETMENGVLHYNLELYNMGSTDIYLPDVTTDDLLLGAALLDPNGNDVTAAYGEPTALPAGYRLIYRYMQTADGDYADLILHLQEAVATFGDTYGMQIRMVSRPLDEIRSGLSVEIDRSAESGLSVRMTLEPRFAEDRQITFAVALYDEQGRMIDLRMAGETLKAEETLVSAWVSLTEANAHTVAVMAMDTQYVPILPLWTQTLK